MCTAHRAAREVEAKSSFSISFQVFQPWVCSAWLSWEGCSVKGAPSHSHLA